MVVVLSLEVASLLLVTMRFVAVIFVMFIHTELCQAESTLPTPSNCTVKAHLPCIQYSFFKTTDCAPANLARLFPNLYGQNDWPGQAYAFNIVSIEQYRYNGKLYNVAYVKLTFQPPHNVGVRSLRGFEIMVYKNTANLPTCIIYDLSNATWNGDLEDMRTDFELSMAVSPSATFRLELFCLPRPQLEVPDIDQYQYVNFTTPDYAKPWTAAIYWKIFPTERRVAVTFEASKNHSFEKFELTLHACKCEEDCNCVDILNADSRTQRVTVSDMFYNFTNVSPGNYSIWVMPLDPYPSDYQRCLCQKGNACDPCATTVTAHFQVIYEPTTTLPSPSPQPPSSGSSTPSTSDLVKSLPAVLPTEVPADATDIKIIGSVLGSVLGLGLGVLGFWLYYQRRQKQKTDEHKDTIQENPCFHDDNGSMITIDVLKAGKLGKMANNDCKPRVPLEKEPKLFILYEEDHECHRRVVDSFASYLHHYCHCQVMCASWQQDAAWVHQEMQQADYVVIVNSEAAYNIYRARKGDKSRSGSLPGSGSSPMMTSINCVLETFLQEARYDNIIMVYFEHTAERFLVPDICPGYNYHLMKHFTDFLLHIHGLRRTDNLAQYDLPFDGNHGQRGTVGQELVLAINTCQKYERENPKWFLLKYGMLRSVSNTSDDSQFDSGVDEMPSLPQSPNYEIQEPWMIHPELRAYLPQLDRVSQGAITIEPPPNIPASRRNHPILSPHSFTEDAIYNGDIPSGNQPSTAESGQFDFLPPEDIPDEDMMSKTQSEQMMSIVDRYHCYNRDHDLALLRVQSGEIPFGIDLTNSGDVESLGGQSV